MNAASYPIECRLYAASLLEPRGEARKTRYDSVRGLYRLKEAKRSTAELFWKTI